MTGRRLRSAGIAILATLAAVSFAHPASGSDVTGDAGIDTSIPPTSSARTVSGRGDFASLKITVNQTKDLLNQAVSLTWTGGKPTVTKPALFGGNYLQFMQCWGDDDGTVPENPGPPPEQCVFGATQGAGFPIGSFAASRIMFRGTWDNLDKSAGVYEDATQSVWRGFTSVDGRKVGSHINPDFDPADPGSSLWLNDFFNIVTTNEVAASRTLADGTGQELFAVETGVESSGLGCGQDVEPVPGGGTRIPKCWLVAVPRSDAATENAGTGIDPLEGVTTSPLSPAAWKNRIAVPLEFSPVDTSCKLGDDTRRLVGSELAAPAMFSWQPKLCGRADRRPFAYGTVGDAAARQQLLTNAPGSAGMYVTSQPVDGDLLDETDPIVYAPLTVSGVGVGFTVERRPGQFANDDADAIAGSRVQNINLTPRLLAKLLTQSYPVEVDIMGVAGYGWDAHNPLHMGVDPDFLRFNPEFKEIDVINRKTFGGLLLPGGTSDAAQQVWKYVLSDPEAKAWLDGEPDQWGMRVNPVYSTKADLNPQGAPFADPLPNLFPKSDPYCYQPPDLSNGSTPTPLCGTDWLPYVQSMHDGARLTRAADDASRTEARPYLLNASQYWGRTVPQAAGTRAILALTDTASANLYGIQLARLSGAGDDGDGRAFVAPTTDALLKGVDAMRPGAEPSVLEPEAGSTATGAYPLTMLSYGAIRPLDRTTEERTDYAELVEYAAGNGQVSGQAFGELPVGYAPLPDALRTQALKAATSIRQLKPLPEEEEEQVDEAVEEPEAPSSSEAPSTLDAAPAFTNQVVRRVVRRTQTPLALDPLPIPTVASTGATGATPLQEAPTTRVGRTAAFSVPISRFAVPAFALVALVAALGALEITKRPRRWAGAVLNTSDAP